MKRRNSCLRARRTSIVSRELCPQAPLSPRTALSLASWSQPRWLRAKEQNRMGPVAHQGNRESVCSNKPCEIQLSRTSRETEATEWTKVPAQSDPLKAATSCPILSRPIQEGNETIRSHQALRLKDNNRLRRKRVKLPIEAPLKTYYS